MLDGGPNTLVVSKRLSTVIATVPNYPHCRLNRIAVTFAVEPGKSPTITAMQPMPSADGSATHATWP